MRDGVPGLEEGAGGAQDQQEVSDQEVCEAVIAGIPGEGQVEPMVSRVYMAKLEK